MLYSRDPESLARIHELRAGAVRTFARSVAPLAGSRGDSQQFWRRALELTFRSELRAESPERARQLVDEDADYFAAVTALLPPEDRRAGLPGPRLTRGTWWLRAATGKLLSLCRLMKGAYTFDGGLDYIVWKLERHSGRRIDVPDRVRRHPGIFIWGFAWRLYREGVFR